MKKITLVLIVLALVAAFFGLGYDHYLTLEHLKASQAQFHLWFEQSPLLIALAFFTLYVVVTALSLPGAAIMTIAAGALFGLGLGTLIASFASSIGATLAFLASRFLLRDTVQARFSRRLEAINRGVAKDGAFYLFTVRLVPLFPFFVINLAMGVTPIRTWTFYWVSQAGMLIGTLVYVNAGTQLASIEHPADILSPQLILSLLLLAALPWLAKAVLGALRRGRVYRKWRRPARYDRNLIVIGAGAAGLVTAYIAAAVKAKVTLVEANKMGGDCLNYGCVPSKALLKSAKVAQQIKHAEHYGLVSSAPRFSFKTVMQRVHQVVTDVEPHDSVERYTQLGVEVLQGYAKLVDPWTVAITLNSGGTQTLTARSLVIATGAEPVVPPLAGLAEVGYVTSDTLWQHFSQLDQPPARLIVLGGGPIGCELAQAFARLGSEVFQIERGGRILAREDEDVSAQVQQTLSADGVHVLTQHQAIGCETQGARKFLVVEHEQQQSRIEFDQLICAVGRRARLSGYGLEELGIPVDHTITTNEYLETLYPNIYAAGDVAGPYQFTHTASHMAWYASVNALFGPFKRFKVDYSVIPRATFVDPEVARVGLNEQDAKQQGVPYDVSRFALADLDRAIADSATAGFIKVLTVPGKDNILGVTIVGAQAAELLAEYVLAMRHGLGLNKILGTIHVYPTFAEANKYVAGEWKKAHAPAKLLRILARYHRWRRGG